MATIFALRGRTWCALPAVALPLLFAACGNEPGGGPIPLNDSGSTETDGFTPVPDTGDPITDASDAGSSGGFGRGRIASGTGFSCALDENGAPVCWGPRYNNTARTPTKTGFTWIAGGGEEVCALDGTGEILCWDSRISSSGAVVRDAPKGPFVEVAIGSQLAAEYACARRASGEIACWRSAELSQRPELTTPPSGATFNRTSLGANAACGIQTTGTLLCWGSGVVTTNVPTASFTDLGVAEFIGCAINASGRPECWGPATSNFVTNFPAGQRSAQLVGSSYAGFMCSVLTSGSIFCAEAGSSYPAPANNANIREVALSEDHYCYVNADRSVGCQTNLTPNPYMPPATLRVLAR